MAGPKDAGGNKPETGVRLFGRIKDRLVASKRKAAAEGRHLTGDAGAGASRDRLPPGQRLVEKWPVLDLGVRPYIDMDRWRLTVDGLVEAPAAWSWEAFLALPQGESTSDIHCVTTWSLYGSRWRGVLARDLMDVVKPKPEARFVIFHSYDGYTTNVPLDRFAGDDVLLARERNGEPIPSEHGGPVRVVIPALYFWKSAKWVRRIEFAVDDKPGYWEVRGYHNEADPWKEERYG